MDRAKGGRLLVALAVTAAMAAVACSPAAAEPEIRVVMIDFRFTPQRIEVPAGRTVEFRLTNSGRVEHDITAEALGLHAHVMPAERLSFQSGPFSPGEYDIFCSVVGHRQAGMIGKLVVTP